MPAPMPDFRKLQLLSDVSDLIGDVDRLLATAEGDRGGTMASTSEQARKSLERVRASLRHVEATMPERRLDERMSVGARSSGARTAGLRGTTSRLLHGLMHR